MREFPSAEQMLAAVAAFLKDEAAPNLPPRQSFDARVAANAVEMIRRQIMAEGDREAERKRLAALLGEEGDLDALTAALTAKVREGEMDLATPGLAEHLWRTAMDKLAVDQPRFGPYRRLAAAEGARG